MTNQKNDTNSLNEDVNISLEIHATQRWLEEIIIGLNFCPFAKKEWINNTIHYELSSEHKIKHALVELEKQCEYLVDHEGVETTLVIYNKGFSNFEQYLSLVDVANDMIFEQGYEGIFQLASFHPHYCFGGEDFDDAANYTNRSPYPLLHIIREVSMEKVLSVYKNPEDIPNNNIQLAREKGANFFQDALERFCTRR